MKSGLSPDLERVYEQLLWVERRRFRIIESVRSHFGKTEVERALSAQAQAPLLDENQELKFLLEDTSPSQFISQTAEQVLRGEATTVSCLRGRVSIYREHVDEQILFGARTAGQEAGRFFSTPLHPAKPRSPVLSVPEAVQAVFDLNFCGMPGEKNLFPILRAQAGSSVHFVRSPFLDHWRKAGADPKFLYQVRCEWIRGILDILSPRLEFHTASAIELGHAFGLEHFLLKGTHAGP